MTLRQKMAPRRLRAPDDSNLIAARTDLALDGLVPPAGLKPATLRLGGECSIQLSYGGVERREGREYSNPRPGLQLFWLLEYQCHAITFTDGAVGRFLFIGFESIQDWRQLPYAHIPAFGVERVVVEVTFSVQLETGRHGSINNVLATNVADVLRLPVLVDIGLVLNDAKFAAGLKNVEEMAECRSGSLVPRPVVGAAKGNNSIHALRTQQQQ